LRTRIKMKISVIVPTYKPQAYLWECLNSLVAQTFAKDDFEVLLVLNGCLEPYKSEIESYLAKNKDKINIRFISTETPGVSNARNIALDNAKGEYIAFIDDDDYVSQYYLEELYANASSDTISLCYPYAFNDGFANTQLSYGITDAYDYCTKNGCNSISSKVRKYFSGPCMKLIPMAYIQDRRFDVRFKNGEDCIFMFLISDKYRKMAFTSKNAIYYRRFREGSAVTSKRSKKEQSLNSLKCMYEYTKIFLRGKYSLYFYASRIAAELCSQLRIIIEK